MNILNVFKDKKEKPSIKGNGQEIYETLLWGLNQMEKNKVNRIPLTLYEKEPANHSGQWLHQTPYYPFEILTKEEQELILKGKSYQVIALVQHEVPGVVKYGHDEKHQGIEQYSRDLIMPFLPKLKPESTLNYVTQGGLISMMGLEDFAHSVAKDGWTKDGIKNSVEYGINEYHEITKKLKEAAGLNKALERIKDRSYTPFEEVLLKL